jgi:hypothetical protein
VSPAGGSPSDLRPKSRDVSSPIDGYKLAHALFPATDNTGSRWPVLKWELTGWLLFVTYRELTWMDIFEVVRHWQE